MAANFMLAPAAPPGAAPSLAWLAYSRLGFGARPGDIDFGNDVDAFNAYIDSQLDSEGIDDSACDAYIAGMSRKGQDGFDVPPLNASTKQIKQYVDAAEARNSFANGELGRYLVNVTYARALLSKKQLFEIMVDFWSNHFNTTISESVYKYWEDHHVMRRYALGNFRDLVGGSAKSPSMLRYLSNAYSDGSNPNENYGRELMELHTLGSINRIPGHANFGQPNYTEVDVHRVAGILSGWTYVRSEFEEFRFNDSPDWPTHDYSGKELWLGGNPLGTQNMYLVPYGGAEQGEMLLDILSEHPSTAWFVSRKLCRRFISDDPDGFCPTAVRAGAEAFINTHGEIRAVLAAILKHEDFRRSWGQKVKRPFEFYISMLRTLDVKTYPPPKTLGEPDEEDWELYGHLESIGQRLFEMPPPTGYPDFKTAWMNSNQVFSRWSIANAIVRRYFGEYIQNESTQWKAVAPQNGALNALLGAGSTATQVVDRLLGICFGRAIHADDRTALINYLGNNNPNAIINSQTFNARPFVAALIASPYFQWR
jgi:uncharacterized protein (DUF1800 family)